MKKSLTLVIIVVCILVTAGIVSSDQEKLLCSENFTMGPESGMTFTMKCDLPFNQHVIVRSSGSSCPEKQQVWTVFVAKDQKIKPGFDSVPVPSKTKPGTFDYVEVPRRTNRSMFTNIRNGGTKEVKFVPTVEAKHTIELKFLDCCKDNPCTGKVDVYQKVKKEKN